MVLDENKANATKQKSMKISSVKGKRKGKGIKIGI